MVHTFTITLSEEISSVLAGLRTAITGNGGGFKSNMEYGFFDGKSVLGLIKGEYRRLAGNEIEIKITHKPFIPAQQD